MATTAVELCNIALARAGVSKVLTSMTEASTEAGLCRVLYPTALETVLSMAPWPFATKRAVLAPLAGGGRGGYAFRYQLPADCLVVQEVFSGRGLREDQKVPFRVENEGDARVLLTDQEDAEIIYTARVESPTLFHPLFVDALAWKLAGDLAISLAKDDDAATRFASRANNRFLQIIEWAKAQAVGEQRPDKEPESIFLTVRAF